VTAPNGATKTDFLAGTGELGDSIRAFDRTCTLLGPIESWPQSLKTSVSLILSSRHPMWIGWGAEMTFLYNDAYLHVLGPAKHPGALGRQASEVWAEIWNVCGPLALIQIRRNARIHLTRLHYSGRSQQPVSSPRTILQCYGRSAPRLEGHDGTNKKAIRSRASSRCHASADQHIALLAQAFPCDIMCGSALAHAR
jgi:hypothetical protein